MSQRTSVKSAQNANVVWWCACSERKNVKALFPFLSMNIQYALFEAILIAACIAAIISARDDQHSSSRHRSPFWALLSNHALLWRAGIVPIAIAASLGFSRYLLEDVAPQLSSRIGGTLQQMHAQASAFAGIVGVLGLGLGAFSQFITFDFAVKAAAEQQLEPDTFVIVVVCACVALVCLAVHLGKPILVHVPAVVCIVAAAVAALANEKTVTAGVALLVGLFFFGGASVARAKTPPTARIGPDDVLHICLAVGVASFGVAASS